MWRCSVVVLAGCATAPATVPAVPVAKPIPDSPACAKAAAAWADRRTPAGEQAEAYYWIGDNYEACSDAQLAAILATSIARLNDHSIVVNDGPTDGPTLAASNVATQILMNITHRQLGTMVIGSYGAMGNPGPLHPHHGKTPEANDAYVGMLWRAWWAQVGPARAVSEARMHPPPPFELDARSHALVDPLVPDLARPPPDPCTAPPAEGEIELDPC